MAASEEKKQTQQTGNVGDKGQPRKKIAIALQGGGSHGAFTWGVLDSLLEDGRLDIEGLSGTSAGGMNAVALAQGLLRGGLEGGRQEMRRFWQKIADGGLFSPYHRAFFPQSLDMRTPQFDPFRFFSSLMQNVFSPYQTNPLNINILRDMVEAFFDFELLRSAKELKLFLCATHVNTGKLKLFTLDTLTPQKMLASACLPFLFHAVEVDGENYWDGGFVGNPAIYPLIYSCDTPDIMVIQLTVMNRKRLPLTAHEVIERHKEITYNACLMREMRMIDFVGDLMQKGIIQEGTMKRLNMHLVRNESLFNDLDLSSALNPDWGFIHFLFEEGRKSGKAWIEKNYDAIGRCHSTNLHKEFVAESADTAMS
ncbi:patatin-like phospholipase family protein [Candidatus Hepatobacter penaei]|uniref:patatin-like phospholipase family protein n=1 Tax=Candidatus Hepatobacter penaei TaxID=1274402 RepID=UPI0006960D8D|nr:patatin-like phospholipase family protein [Candidatus Hepatobacter penaei]TGW14628.1 patatin-like phospholipase family protein [bacterium NHP-B]